jgi:hypothetical protein
MWLQTNMVTGKQFTAQHDIWMLRTNGSSRQALRINMGSFENTVVAGGALSKLAIALLLHLLKHILQNAPDGPTATSSSR